jgi:hypothetical protein
VQHEVQSLFVTTSFPLIIELVAPAVQHEYVTVNPGGHPTTFAYPFSKLTILAARGVGIFTIEFADPHTTETPSDEFLTLPNDVSWQYPITTNIQTLSAKNNGGDPFGILYVPDLRTEECRRNEEESAHVPRNATRLRHLPPDTNYSLVAIAPWFSPACMQEYFESARQDPVQAFLVFLPGQSAEMPPLMNDARWALGDGGAWKSANDFPTYAIMSVSGNITMGQLSLYSGNVSEVPHGDAIAALNNPLFQPTDCVRLWARIKTGEFLFLSLQISN